MDSETPVVLCVENLDDGVIQASYPLLKFIEDCPRHVYTVVTCRSLAAIPETILSRCALVNINSPTKQDIEQYAIEKDPEAYGRFKDKRVWGCVRSFEDVDRVLGFTPEQLQYFINLEKLAWTKDTVSNLSWKLQHYEDKAETPLALVIRYLMQVLPSNDRKTCIDCLNDLADNRISKNAIISKLIFELKYTK